MCGICGFTWEDKALVKRMMGSLAHRGPDQEGMFCDKGISLGHRRLSIIDLSEKGRQPMFNEEGDICVVFNGEIYNFQELRPELEKKGHRFSSHTDTEVIVHAYEEWGQDCVTHFNGEFAFAIWDGAKNLLFAARDPLGVKPFYYLSSNGSLIFASEIKALLQHDIPKEMNLSCLTQLINFAYPVNGETLFKGIKELPPGHVLTFSGDGPSLTRYWEMEVREGNKSESFYVSRFTELLEAAVRRRLISDVPLGVTLSGGLDSSTIVALASRMREEKLKTFTIGFEGVDTEFKAARSVAEHCGMDHHEILIGHEDYLKGMLHVLWHMEYPLSRPAMVPVYSLFKHLRDRVTVSLSGDGADELLGGYNRYDAYTPPAPDIPSAIKEKIAMPLSKKIASVSSGVFNTDREEFFNPSALPSLPPEIRLEHSVGPQLRAHEKDGKQLNHVLRYELKTGIPYFHCNKLDRNSMAHGHEVRVPYLDYTLVEFSLTVPPNYKFLGDEKKILLQKVAAPLLPPSIVKRRKLPMVVPLDDFFEKSFIDFTSSLLSETRLSSRPYYRVPAIRKLISSIREGKSLHDQNRVTPDNSYRQLLFFTNLELWTRMFLENDPKKKPSFTISSYL